MPQASRIAAVAAFLAAGAASAVAARALVQSLETISAEAVRAELARGGHDWAAVIPDGLQVVLEGEAPTEAMRFRAISAAGAAVDASRVIDNMRVADAADLPPPAFSVEILRGEGGISMIGLVPDPQDRERLVAAARRAAGDAEVVDLLEVAEHPVPEGWNDAVDFATAALAELPRSKISVGPGRLAVEAVADSPEERRQAESFLAREKPAAVSLALDVSAPRPVIAPFTLRFRLDDGAASFDACSAESEESRAAILAAARAAGAAGALDCRVGLGAPSPDWGAAVAAGIGAVAAMGGGSVTFSDADVLLLGPAGADPAAFERAAGSLRAALPPVFAFDARRPEPAAATAGPAEFRATLAAGGAVRLQGPLPDGRAVEMARAFAQARFGADGVAMATRVAPAGLPPGWTVRVLAGVEALGRMGEGEVVVTPDLLSLSGRTGDAAAHDEIAARAIALLGPDARLDLRVAYDEALDPLAALPTPEECLAEIAAVTDRAKIAFDPGSATLSADGEAAVEEVAGVLRSCGDLRLRISGYTDSQGSEDGNLRLSQARAQAVLEALRAERVPVGGFEAQGFGEADPVAPNDTEAGREANRRIAFSLIDPPAAPAAAGPATGPTPGPAPDAGPAVVSAEPFDGPQPPPRPTGGAP